MSHRQYQINQWEEEAKALIRWGCEKVGMDDVADNIVINFNDRMRTTMGRAWTNYGLHTTFYGSPAYVQVLNAQKERGGLIAFCIALYERVDQAERRRNILHELAHILANLKLNANVAAKREKSANHGRHWKAMMGLLGETPTRCHNNDTNGLKRRQRRFKMFCPDRCGWSFTFAAARRTRRINKARRGETRRCPKCQASITLQHWLNTREV
jgi:predicted SprT family Zn-dependent metalloprotease